ncbi:glycosyl hydrolase family 38 [Marinilabiliaceae bacterium JC017]|nr:glycosyl hydrolase family 38 [Marinilabiliaceae bacterium JC017]
MKHLGIFSLLILICIGLRAQDAPKIGKNEHLLQGFEQKIAGTDFSYHSAVPDVTESMLIRATNGTQSMEWETEAVPADFDAQYATFVWLAGYGCNVANVRMDMEIDGQKKFEFYTQRATNWTLKNEDGSSLSWYSDFVDRAGDRSGFMFLKVPRKLLKKGKPLQVKVTGSNSNSSAWYMTFKSQIKSGLTMKTFPALIKNKKGAEQVVAANIYYFDRPAKATIYKDGKKLQTLPLKFGYNFVTLNIPSVNKPTETTFKVTAPGYEKEAAMTLKPVRKWQVNFVQHSHTDIGYTRPQTEIIGEHLRYIDYALDFCDATDNYPDDAKFRWTCEAAFAVNDYLRSRPAEQVERLKRRIKEGRIEITGMYFNFDEMPDEQTLAASLAPFKRFKDENIEVKTAMQNDVNGIGWCFNDYFNSLGVKYLTMGTHGHRALICFDKPTAFWWESPSGNRMLTFRAEHYMTGNTVFGIHTSNFKEFENKLMSYLSDLDKKGYEYEIIPIQYSGYLTDNAPPSTLANEMIRKWNEKYTYPRLRQALPKEFFEEIEARHSDDLPVYRGAWPDWWTDGFASGAREAAASRQTHTDLIAYQGALSIAAMMGSKMPEGINDRIGEANRALLYYDEHTFGAAESVREPYARNTMEQRAIKESYAWEAFRRSRMVGEEAMGLLQSHFSREEVPTILVFNTINWQRSGMAEVYIDHQILPPGKLFSITDSEGNKMAAQPLQSRHDGTYWGIWVNDIPAMGYKKLRLTVEGDDKSVAATGEQPVVSTLDNQWYTVSIDTDKGVITSIKDKELNKELVDQKAQWGMGQFIYELLQNRSQMEAYTLTDYTRQPLDSVWFNGYSEGPVYNTIKLAGKTAAAFDKGGFEMEIRLYNTDKRIELVYTIHKKPVLDPEGIYIALPFQLENGKHHFEVQGGIIEAGVDQIPGSSNDWNTVQNFATVNNGQAQIIVNSPQIPLMQFGGINTGRYTAGATPESTHIYGWPMNNYWTTNFNADQRGEFTFSYQITSSGNSNFKTASQFGWGTRVPLLARTLPAGPSTPDSDKGQVMNITADNLLLINASPVAGENAIMMHVREVNGQTATFELTTPQSKSLTIQEADVLGRPLKRQPKTISFKPYATKFIKISW